MFIQTEYTWYTTKQYQYWFWADFPQKKILSETWTHPPTHFHSQLGFLEFVLLCKARLIAHWLLQYIYLVANKNKHHSAQSECIIHLSQSNQTKLHQIIIYIESGKNN